MSLISSSSVVIVGNLYAEYSTLLTIARVALGMLIFNPKDSPWLRQG